jgi:hypothetical protein
MRRSREILLWTVLGLAGAALLVWAYPHAFPFLPHRWSVNRDEAEGIALTRLNDLGDPVQDGYVVATLQRDSGLERRLNLELMGGKSASGAGRPRRMTPDELRATGLPDQVVAWEIYVYPPGGLREDWTYEALVAPTGEVLSLLLRLDPQAKGAPISPQQARDRADAFLVQQGIDLSRYGEPQIRSTQLAARTDLAVRYPALAALPSGAAYGMQVRFAGDRLTGFTPWMDDPQERQIQAQLRPAQFTGVTELVATYLLVALLAVPFLRRYHEGEIGVRRGGQVFVGVAVVGVILILLTVRPGSQSVGFGIATRQQTAWIFGLLGLVFSAMPLALLAFLAWSVGESTCRERWGHRLAAFDSVFQRQWNNSTVARSALRGFTAGVALAGLIAAILAAVWRIPGAAPQISFFVPFQSRWPGIELVARFVGDLLPVYLVAALCILPLLARRLSRGLAALLTAILVSPVLLTPMMVVPPQWGIPASLVAAAAPLLLFLGSDLLAALLCALVGFVLLSGYPLLIAHDSTLRVHGWIAMALVASPMLLSLRWLSSRREFVYRYEDVAPHVRRIAERERQRVELETARRIQSSILPELPPSLYGVQIAHAYLPASEVGGDFYDVLALEDGRLAIAVGDVAGHGVSSGLVMSMAKSALAVQVTFDPDVAAVFGTLNRTIFQSARKRLLATLCYALLDPRKRELLYASAGHLFPYRITSAGEVLALESIAYPLGVRGELRVEPRAAQLSPGDTLFLFSDGLVEARPEGSDQLFGFERLEQSLARYAHRGVEGLRDGVLADLARFTGNIPREDDQTIVALRLP